MGEKNDGVDIFALSRLSSGNMGKEDILGRQKNHKYFWVEESDN